MEEVVFDRELVTPEWVESVRRVVTSTSSALRVLRFARAAKRHNVEERLAGVAAPNLLVWGAGGGITPPVVAPRFHPPLPASPLTLPPRCGPPPTPPQPEALRPAEI